MTNPLSKSARLSESIACIPSGATIMVGGFGSPGTPFALLEELLAQGQRELTLIKNDANEPNVGIGPLIATGRVRRLITSHIGLNPDALERMKDGRLEVTIHPQGLLAEKIRSAGAGHYGFITDIGVDTEIIGDRQQLSMDGRTWAIEPALTADFALVHADVADDIGNLRYRATAINFNPLMAMAANHVIAQAHQVLPTGALEPASVYTPAAFVDEVIEVSPETSERGLHVRLD